MSKLAKVRQSQVVEYRQFMVRLEQEVLKGYTSQNELAAKFGKPASFISIAMKRLNAAWKERGPNTTKAARRKRVKQLEYVIQLAHLSFAKSKEEQIDSSEALKDDICFKCNGLGNVMVQGCGEECPRCAGKGYLRSKVDTVRKRLEPGDAAFLSIVTGCLREINRLEGNYSNIKVDVKTEGKVLHAHLVVDGKLLTPEAMEAVIGAKAALDAMRTGNERVIEGVGRITELEEDEDDGVD